MFLRTCSGPKYLSTSTILIMGAVIEPPRARSSRKVETSGHGNGRNLPPPAVWFVPIAQPVRSQIRHGEGGAGARSCLVGHGQGDLVGGRLLLVLGALAAPEAVVKPDKRLAGLARGEHAEALATTPVPAAGGPRFEGLQFPPPHLSVG